MYRPQQGALASSFLQKAVWQPAPPPILRPVPSTAAQGKPASGCGAPPVYHPLSSRGVAPPPAHRPNLSGVSQFKALVASSPGNSLDTGMPVNQSGPPAVAEAQRNAIFPSLNTVQAASYGPIRTTKKREASRLANQKMGLDPTGGHRARVRRQVVPYDASPEGKYGIVLFTFRGARKRGLNPGSRYVRKVTIDYTGTRAGDYVAAGGAAPAGHVWHHYHNYNPSTGRGTMYLMTVTDHAPRHHGGVWMYEQAHGVVYG